jgi:serine protease Do
MKGKEGLQSMKIESIKKTKSGLRSRLPLWLVILISSATLFAGGWVAAMAGHSGPGASQLVPVKVSSTIEDSGSGSVSLFNGFADVVKQDLPAIVNIASSKVVKPPQEDSPFFTDPFFRQFFGGQFSPGWGVPREHLERSLGSGVIVSPEGYILTNNHVVDGASKIQVFLPDKREIEGKIIGTDPKTDIAVVKIAASKLPTVAFADSSTVRVGDFALAIGNPFGIGETVSMGIISATGRGGLGIEDYEDFIQTDAAINPGNSGGALVNVRGELIGINTAILSRGGGGNQGVGFAIPSNMARQVMQQILENGRVIRGYLGVTVQAVTPALAESFGLPTANGALIGDVKPGSPADRSGLKRGDIVLALEGSPIADQRELSLKISMIQPGTTVHLTVYREGSNIELTTKLEELVDNTPAEPEAKRGTLSGSQLGMAVEPLTPAVKSELGLPPQTTGIVISEVAPGSIAHQAGLQRGDVIQEVDGKAVTDLSEFGTFLRESNGNAIRLLIDRGNSHLFMVLETQ